MDRYVNIVTMSDIHYGHDKNKTSNIVNNQNAWMSKYKKDIQKADIFIIPGDVFDKLLSPSSNDSILAYGWLTNLLLFCKENNIKVRILEGTPSHDRKQVMLLDEIIQNLKIENLDYKYIPILDYEYIEDLDIDILYIPDVWKPTAQEVYKDVLKKLKEVNKDKVDMVVMHGAFKYQMPDIESDQFHDEDVYNDLVNYLIISGHIHDTSTYNKILVPGSFDRLTHTDGLKPKGGYFITIDKSTQQVDMKFLPNNNALPFITIDITDKDIKYIDNELKRLSKTYVTGHIRFVNKKDNSDKVIYIEEIKRRYPQFRITITSKVKDIEDKLDLGKKKTIELKVLNDEVIENYINEEIRTLEDDELKRIILEEYKNLSNL